MSSEQQTQRKRARLDTIDTDSSDVTAAKRIRDDLLVLLDDTDIDTTPPGDDVIGTGVHELDSVIKSFEEELSGSGGCTLPTTTDGVISVSDSGEESHPELGYLLGASDDELGLPSTAHQTVEDHNLIGDEVELIRVSSDSSGIGDELWQFDERLGSYDDPFGFGITGCDVGNTFSNDFVSLDGIFDYSDVNYGPSDYTTDENNNTTWRQETLPAL